MHGNGNKLPSQLAHKPDEVLILGNPALADMNQKDIEPNEDVIRALYIDDERPTVEGASRDGEADIKVGTQPDRTSIRRRQKEVGMARITLNGNKGQFSTDQVTDLVSQCGSPGQVGNVI